MLWNSFLIALVLIVAMVAAAPAIIWGRRTRARINELTRQLEDLTRDRLEDVDFAYSAPRHHFLGIGGELKVKPRGGGTDWIPVLHRGERVVPASALERAAAAASDASRREADEIARRPISADLLNPASPVGDSGD